MHAMFASLIEYPGETFQPQIAAAEKSFAAADPAIAELVSIFGEKVREKTLDDLQELFTGSFDMDPECTLDLGWHLFGDDYKRGVFLAKVRRELARHEVHEVCELPDHLTHVLRLLAKMEAGEGNKFAQACVIPAVKKVSDVLEKRESIYSPLYKALVSYLEKHHSLPLKGDAHA